MSTSLLGRDSNAASSEARRGTERAPTSQSLLQVDISQRWEESFQPPASVFSRYLPRGVVTLLSGHGGVGKSTFILTVAAHLSAGAQFMGIKASPIKTVFISLEDPASVVVHRLRKIAEGFNLNTAQLIANIQVFDGSATDSVLVDGTGSGMRDTPALAEAQKITAGADLIVIDNASDAFSGNENARADVRFFMRRLNAIAQRQQAALVLLAHVDKNTAKSRVVGAGNSYSGSTAWHNSARSRLVLSSERGMVKLTHEKSNLLQKMPDVWLSIDRDGLLRQMSHREQNEFTPSADEVAGILEAFTTAAEVGDVIHGKIKTGNGTAVQDLSSYQCVPDSLKAGTEQRRRMVQVLRFLKQQKRIVEVPLDTGYRKKDRTQLVLAPNVGNDSPALPPVSDR
jgi:RecA-family ATPase